MLLPRRSEHSARRLTCSLLLAFHSSPAIQSARTRGIATAQFDGRNRLSAFWAPTSGVGATEPNHNDSSALLSRAGFIRQSGSGVFHLLPLGLRVQQKIESLIDKHMTRLGASKLSLSSITSEALWTRSGRFNGENPEMYRLAGQKGTTGHLLAPTHEEEITEIVKGAIQSYRDLPARLYQISRKYRNELRPRQGLLRAREFTMKDLYTFDVDETSALETYNQVRAAYAAFFDELKIPYVVAEADSGDMGGNLSHEFHFASEAGEDTVYACNSCSYALNEELTTTESQVQDSACPRCKEGKLQAHRAVELGHTFHLGTRYSVPLEATVAVPAPTTDGRSHTPKAKATPESADTNTEAVVPIQMGCHGIGVSRLIGAVTSILADDKGLNWPRAIAPFDVVIVPREGFEADAEVAYSTLVDSGSVSSINASEPRVSPDVLLDDRPERVPWKLGDADLIGYPVIVVLGKAWKEKREFEVQCRRLGGLRENVPEMELAPYVSALLSKL